MANVGTYRSSNVAGASTRAVAFSQLPPTFIEGLSLNSTMSDSGEMSFAILFFIFIIGNSHLPYRKLHYVVVNADLLLSRRSYNPNSPIILMFMYYSLLTQADKADIVSRIFLYKKVKQFVTYLKIERPFGPVRSGDNLWSYTSKKALSSSLC
ncbi:uncharacterized protein [Rutidosis leptorrhynchoides]|uniref:uncharacterized protein n=1 Tax=Rutidosis leptorrhynchoides TaxID=125765 RepID=UPI003A9A52E3